MAYFMKYLRQFDKQIGAFKLAVSISVLGKDFKLGHLFLFSLFSFYWCHDLCIIW